MTEKYQIKTFPNFNKIEQHSIVEFYCEFDKKTKLAIVNEVDSDGYSLSTGHFHPFENDNIKRIDLYVVAAHQPHNFPAHVYFDLFGDHFVGVANSKEYVHIYDREIIATTNIEKDLPLLPTIYIEYYVEQYNMGYQPNEIELIFELSNGWIPSYNDPDNSGLHPEAEPILKIRDNCVCPYDFDIELPEVNTIEDVSDDEIGIPF